MRSLIVFALLWLALHIGLSGTSLRGALVVRLGERGFRGAFAAASALLLAALVVAYHNAEGALLWAAPDWLRWLTVLAMLPACVLFVGSLSPGNPTMVGTAGAGAAAARGIFRVTRHPMLCSFAIWSGAHALTNGDAASLVFFGTFLLTVLGGIPSIDGKLARRDPANWAALAAVTSRMPFAAIVAGRNRLSLPEVGWKPPILGTMLWVVLLFVHPYVLGAPALPG
jgi:uncharacterized membrane protein